MCAALRIIAALIARFLAGHTLVVGSQARLVSVLTASLETCRDTHQCPTTTSRHSVHACVPYWLSKKELCTRTIDSRKRPARRLA
ncbi:hypothetical protein C8Q79DRAFT_954809 [Trametes meyenii]|nr:hypothetical protein C8Q79DRAFT_954809 [Trametes meyenii]